MSIKFKNFVFNENKKIIEDKTSILCEVENEKGGINIIMLPKQQLVEAGYEVPNNSSLYEKEIEESPNTNEDDDEELSTITKSNIDEWADKSTRFLLDKYAEYLEQVGPMKKFKSKKVMWTQIAKDLETVVGIKKTYLQCENRYKTIIRRKRVGDKNNSTSGSKRMKISFEDEIKQITAIDDSVEPEVLHSSNKFVVNIKNNSLTQKNKSEESIKVKSKNSKCNLLVETLVEIHKEKEAERQQRHEEKLQLLKSFLDKENSSNCS